MTNVLRVGGGEWGRTDMIFQFYSLLLLLVKPNTPPAILADAPWITRPPFHAYVGHARTGSPDPSSGVGDILPQLLEGPQKTVPACSLFQDCLG